LAEKIFRAMTLAGILDRLPPKLQQKAVIDICKELGFPLSLEDLKPERPPTFKLEPVGYFFDCIFCHSILISRKPAISDQEKVEALDNHLRKCEIFNLILKHFMEKLAK